ncbi:MAG TPA: MCP four helix bundle domain-containing protein, partial [Magnetospirillum sp.]|nr:MCP four helix bundle domain-containing protein [Magnetospirillum sp.]
MRALDNLKLSHKLLAAFGALLLVFCITSAVSLVLVNAMDEAADEVGGRWLPSVMAADELEKQVLQHRRFELTHVLSTSDADMADMDRRIVQYRASLAEAQRTYERLIASPEARAVYNEFSAALRRYLSLSDRMLDLSRRNANEEAFALARGEGRQVFTALADDLRKLVEMNVASAAQARLRQDEMADKL